MSRYPRPMWGGGTLLGLSCLTGAIACASEEARLRGASRDLGNAIEEGDAQALEAATLVGQRARLDRSILGDETAREQLAAKLSEPVAVQVTATMLVGDGDVVQAAALDGRGWAFSDDPSDFYGQSTPRDALRSFVRASRLDRWDVLLRLAPRRYRMGLSEEDLRRAWTQGEEAVQLVERRDRLAAHIDAVIRFDAHQAIMPLGEQRFARLERESGRWVVVDF